MTALGEPVRYVADRQDGAQVLLAFVCHVWGEDDVNLMVVERDGRTSPATNVRRDESASPETGTWHRP